MNSEQLITLDQICECYEVETTFLHSLHDHGLVEIVTIEKKPCIPVERLADVEKIMRLHRELNINLAGIDTVLNLLERMKKMQRRMRRLEQRLALYE